MKWQDLVPDHELLQEKLVIIGGLSKSGVFKSKASKLDHTSLAEIIVAVANGFTDQHQTTHPIKHLTINKIQPK